MVKLAAVLSALVLASPAEACRLALVLAVDVSNSVDADEDFLQRKGLAAALLAPDVQAAFFVSPEPVALLAFEWSGRHHQNILQDWIMVDDPADLLKASQNIGNSVRGQRDFPTAMGHALGYAATRLREQQDCLFKTIDVAGDGANNDGFGPAEAYAAFPFDEVTVNGLAVDASVLETRDDLLNFFKQNVLRGPGAFLEIADSFADYEATMARKLIRELSAQIIGAANTAPIPNG